MSESKQQPETAEVGPSEAAPSRRGFLAGAAVAAGGAATLAMPNVSRAQTVSWKFQSTWPERDIFHEFARDYVNTVNSLSAGRLQLELLAAGAVVPAFQLQDAIVAGALDGGHGVTAYWYGKDKAFSLFGTPPAFGWNANQLLGWIKYGGGQALYDELVQQILGLDLVGFLTGPMPTQPLGWFTQPIATAEELVGLRYRTVGLAADLYAKLDAAVTILPGGEIVPALDRGLIDAAEFNNPSSDRVLGFPDVAKNYMIQSYHQSAECFEILFNRTRFNELPAELQTVLRIAAEAQSADMSWKAMDRYSADLAAMRAEQGVNAVQTPEAVLDAQLAAWDEVLAELTQDAFFGRVIESQKAWAQRVVGFQLEYEVSQERAYRHFFPA